MLNFFTSLLHIIIDYKYFLCILLDSFTSPLWIIIEYSYFHLFLNCFTSLSYIIVEHMHMILYILKYGLYLHHISLLDICIWGFFYISIIYHCWIQASFLLYAYLPFCISSTYIRLFHIHIFHVCFSCMFLCYSTSLSYIIIEHINIIYMES